MGYENILYRKGKTALRHHLQRPKVLNALNRKTVEELQHAAARCAQ